MCGGAKEQREIQWSRAIRTVRYRSDGGGQDRKIGCHLSVLDYRLLSLQKAGLSELLNQSFGPWRLVADVTATCHVSGPSDYILMHPGCACSDQIRGVLSMIQGTMTFKRVMARVQRIR